MAGAQDFAQVVVAARARKPDRIREMQLLDALPDQGGMGRLEIKPPHHGEAPEIPVDSGQGVE